jgi:phosphoribosylglycinamide formyltransferase-1
MTSPHKRLMLAVLASGRGSNFEALVRASKEKRMDADVALLVVNRTDAGALDVAKREGIRALVSVSKGRAAEHERETLAAIAVSGADLVCLAGYMRVLSPEFVRALQGKLVNIHPSLLPSFPGLDAQGQAHRAGVRIAGCTVHFVNADVDAGPIVAQAALAVDPQWDAHTLAERILTLEHELYASAVQLIATGKARYDNGRVVFADAHVTGHPIFSPDAS